MSKITPSKKVIHNTDSEHKLAKQSSNVRVGNKMNGRMLKMNPKPIGYDLVYKPSTHTEIVQLADELMSWAELPDSNNIDDFAYLKKMSPYRFKRLNNEYFQECLERVKYYISSKNRSSLIKHNFNEKVYFQELPMLNRDVREYQDEQVAKKLELTSGTLQPTKIIVVDSMLQIKEIKDENENV